MYRSIHNSTVALAAILVAGACQGDGCVTADSPRTFPRGERLEGAVQVRISDTGLTAISQNADGVFGALLPTGTQFNIPEICDDELEVCCGVPAGECTLMFDFREQAGDDTRLAFQLPEQDGDPMQVTVRFRLWNDNSAIPIKYGDDNCSVTVDTRDAGTESLTLVANVDFFEDPDTGATRIYIPDSTLDDLGSGDFDIAGGGNCGLASTFSGIVASMVEDLVGEYAGTLIQAQLCKECETHDQCSDGATCSAAGVCILGDGLPTYRCEQEIGIAGLVAASSLLPGLTGSSTIDMSLVGMGDATMPNDGLSFSLAGGARPGEPEKFGCGSSAVVTAPPTGGIPESGFMAINRVEDLGDFDVALSFHESYLNRMSWAMYESGFVCSLLDTSTIEPLNADALAVLVPSIAQLIRGKDAPSAIRLRPQSPPIMELGGTDSMLNMKMSAVDVDFFVMMDERFVRMFTASTSLDVPLDLEVGPSGTLVPVVANLERHFGPVTVETTPLLADDASVVAEGFSAFGGLTVGVLVGALGELPLPAIAGMQPEIMPNGLRVVQNGEFLAVFTKLRPMHMPRVISAQTDASIVSTVDPPARFTSDQRSAPSVTVAVDTSADREWQYRLNNGAWSPFYTDATKVLRRGDFWFVGHHKIEIRSRYKGQPESTDPSPTVLATLMPSPDQGKTGDTNPPDSASQSSGCSAVGDGGDALWLVLVLGFLFVAVGPRPRRRLSLLGLAATTALGCGLGIPYEREFDPAYGVNNAVATDGSRVVMTTYDAANKDLLLGDFDSGELTLRMVAHGGDVGKFSAVELVDGKAVIAYQDDTRGELRLAFESGSGFKFITVAEGYGGKAGRYVSIARKGRTLGLAYMVEGVPVGGTLITRLAYASVDLSSLGDDSAWRSETIVETEVVSVGVLDDYGQGVGVFASLTYTDDGPAIAYYDRTAGNLMLTQNAGAGWESSILAAGNGSDTGHFAQILADQAGVHAVYADRGDGTLKYVRYRLGQIAERRVIDDGVRGERQHPVGSGASFVRTDSGFAVVYQDTFALEQVVAHRGTSGAWSVTEYPDESAAGFSTAAAAIGDDIYVASRRFDRNATGLSVLEMSVVNR